MNERCHICGRKLKKNAEQCKICKPTPDEFVVAGVHATHNVNMMVNPAVNLLLTSKRLLVFENMSGAGAGVGAVGGGLIGGLIGAAADKLIEKSLGNNGSLKLEAPLAAVTGVGGEYTKKGLKITVTLSTTGKEQAFTLLESFFGDPPTVDDFAAKLHGAATM